MSVHFDVYDGYANNVVINKIVVNGYKSVVDKAMNELASGKSVKIEAKKIGRKPLKASDSIQYYTLELKPLFHQGIFRGVAVEQINSAMSSEDVIILAYDYHFQFI